MDFSKPFILETIAFNFVINIVFSQLRKHNLLHPIAFFFHKFSLVETNYKIHEKKLLTIVDAFEEWHHLFEKDQHEIIVYLDHKNL